MPINKAKLGISQKNKFWDEMAGALEGSGIKSRPITVTHGGKTVRTMTKPEDEIRSSTTYLTKGEMGLGHRSVFRDESIDPGIVRRKRNPDKAIKMSKKRVGRMADSIRRGR